MAMWTVHLDGGPRRVNHAAVCVSEAIYSFGGYCSGDDYAVTRPMDVHVLNTVSYRWHALPIPTEDSEDCIPYQRYGHTAVAYEDCVYVWGGRNDCDGACNTLYCFNTSSHKWSKPVVSADIPGARDGHSACLVNKAMYIFGGYEEQVDMFSNQVHSLDFVTFQWSLLHVTGRAPKWRDFHTAIGVGDNMYVFGGRMDRSGPYHTGHEFYCNKIQILNTATQIWQEPDTTGQVPFGRRSHSVWVHQGFMYVFGGYTGLLNKHFNDIYRFNLESHDWSVVDIQGDVPSQRRRQCCCLVGTRLFLFGGTSPAPTKTNVTTEDALDSNLIDNSDLHVLDYAPSLKTLCCVLVIKHNLPTHELPPDIRWDIAAMTTNGNISRPLNSSG